MSSSKAAPYSLSPKAVDDLDQVWRYTAETWSIDQADAYIDGLVHAFDTIAAMPNMARERTEFAPPVRIQVHQSHLIIYIFSDGKISVLRILGARQNWKAILNATD